MQGSDFHAVETSTQWEAMKAAGSDSVAVVEVESNLSTLELQTCFQRLKDKGSYKKVVFMLKSNQK